MNYHRPEPQNFPHSSGLKAQLTHLLPSRHARFHVRITIHQIASVPLVTGAFGVRWKFKNTQKGKRGKQGGVDTVEHEHENENEDDDSFRSAESPNAPAPPMSSRSATSSSSEVNPDESGGATATRGQTSWAPLQEHSATWDHHLDAVVQMSIERDSHFPRLLPHPFKLTVWQKVVAHDPDAPHNPRLGVVELDLAEYADSFPLDAGVASKGVVTRRYLLGESKTNATLRLSISVEPVPPVAHFVAPPLPSAEILAGVTTLLSTNDDVYRTRPRALNLYAPIEISRQNLEAYDVRNIPRVHGPGPTESLIDALFNPTPVRDERLVTPFTRLVSAETGSVASYTTESSADSKGIQPGHRHTSSVSPSITPSVSSSARESAGPTSEPFVARPWWKRNRDPAASSVTVA